MDVREGTVATDITPYTGGKTMLGKKTLAAAGLLAVTGAVAACGSGSSSTAATGAATAPTGATTTDFCATFQNMANDSTPKQAADKLQAVGTPSDMAADARHGFEVLVDHLEKMPDAAQSKDLVAMEKGLSATDQKDVLAFTTYLTKACVPDTSTPSAPAS
jgi:soluble cytochrome b562